MRRLFSILAVIAGLLLIASFVSAVVMPATARIPLAVTAMMTNLATYAAASTFVELMGKRVETIAGRFESPDWVEAQVEKNRRKVLVYVRFGLPMIGLAVGSDVFLTQGSVYLGLLAANLAFQLGAFFAMSVVIVAQERLLRELQSWSETLTLASKF